MSESSNDSEKPITPGLCLQTQFTWTHNRLLGHVRRKPVLDCRCDYQW